MKQYIATQPLFVGRARAVNPGGIVAESTLKNHPEWADKVKVRTGSGGAPSAAQVRTKRRRTAKKAAAKKAASTKAGSNDGPSSDS